MPWCTACEATWRECVLNTKATSLSEPERWRCPTPSNENPNAPSEWIWHWVFPASRTYVDGATGKGRRHHLHESVLQRAVRQAAARAHIAKVATPNTLRHSLATHLLEDGYDIRTIQELMDHKDVSTTMVYTHVLNRGAGGVRSPLDR